MQFLDRWLQTWRIKVASEWIVPGSRVLDVGCFQGELFKYLEPRLGFGIGLDPLAPEIETGKYRLLSRTFGEDLPFQSESFDALVMLATLEHIQDKEAVARESRRLLKTGGRLIITVPDPAVDRIIDLLVWLRLADGMSLEQHHGFVPADLPGIFTACGFQLKNWHRFQLGMNNLFVFERL
jgi:SAM-dependent methyltransferase